MDGEGLRSAAEAWGCASCYTCVVVLETEVHQLATVGMIQVFMYDCCGRASACFWRMQQFYSSNSHNHTPTVHCMDLLVGKLLAFCDR
jgi:hypothetical protein